MTLETSLANIVVRNNTIDQGRFSTGASPVTYNYAYHSWIYGSSLIEGNTFLAPIASSDMLNIDNCSCTISKNKFVRAAIHINSYIRNYGSNDQAITGNVFDASTVNDATNEELVVGLSNTSLYEGNKNQIAYKVFALQDFTNTADLHYGSSFIALGTDSPSLANLRSQITEFTVSSFYPNSILTVQDTAQTSLGIFFNVSNLLPNGVKLLELKVGVKITGGVIAASSNNWIDLSIGSHDAVSNYATGTNSIMDVNNNALTFPTPARLDYSITVPSGMQYLSLDVSGNSAFETRNKTIHGALQAYVHLTSDVMVITISPIVVRYRY